LSLLICPGIHDPALTECFWASLRSQIQHDVPSHKPLHPLILPIQDYPVYSPRHILQYLNQQLEQSESPLHLDSSLVFISFSAGVVGAIGAARHWHAQHHVKALIALDGWGVPLAEQFPIHRLSHDYFTHWSSALLGTGALNFYADPPVEHLDLWRSPHRVQGWQVSATAITEQQPTVVARFLIKLLQSYDEILV
jgi:hypothetical protein